MANQLDLKLKAPNRPSGDLPVIGREMRTILSGLRALFTVGTLLRRAAAGSSRWGLGFPGRPVLVNPLVSLAGSLVSVSAKLGGHAY